MKNIPETMSAIEIKEPGGPEVLRQIKRKTPNLTEQEVLIKVAACGINRPDIMQRSGIYPPPPGASDIPGLEVAGEIISIGAKEQRWNVGDKVCALVNGGGYAEFVTAPSVQCLPVPPSLTFAEAASLPETFFTVWINVFERAKLKKNETLFVQGGSSGIGVAAIQLGTTMGSEVYVTAGTDEKCIKCENLGAKKAINYKNSDFQTVLLNETDGKGVDVILDMVAGDYIQRELKCLAEDGRIAIIALMGGVKAELNLAELLKRRLSISGSTLRPRSTEVKGYIARQLEKKIWPFISLGEINPVLDTVFPFEKASEAHQHMESGLHFGKIVLQL